MRIRTQNLIAIVPLFLGMAAAAGGLTYTTARDEILWGLQEEASSLSVAIAEFAGGGDVVVERLDSMSAAFERILDHGQARYIFAVDEAGEVLWSAGGERESNAGFVAPPEAIAAAAAGVEPTTGGGALVGPVTELPSGETVMVALTPLPGSDGVAVARLGTVIDASRLSTLSAALLFDLGRMALVAVLIGTLAALFISSLLARKVRALSKAALEVAGGEYDREIQIGTIQELSDLSNTFNTMSSVLKDLVERTQRKLIEGEQYRTPLDLARTYRQDTWPDLSRAYGGVHVASRSIGGGHPGDVFGLVESDGIVTVFVGRITEGRELDSAISAAAARHTVELGATRWPIDQVLDEVCRLLRFRLDALQWRPEFPGEATMKTFGAGTPDATPLHLDEEQTVLLHTFPGRDGDALHRWKRVFQRMSPESLVDNLGRTLDPDAMGTLVAVGPEAAAVEQVGA